MVPRLGPATVRQPDRVSVVSLQATLLRLTWHLDTTWDSLRLLVWTVLHFPCRVIDCELLTVQAFKHTQARVVQDVHLNTVVEVLEVFPLLRKVILCDALKHCRRSILTKETPDVYKPTKRLTVPDRIVM